MQCRWIIGSAYFVPVARYDKNTISTKAYEEEEEERKHFECRDDLQQMHLFSAF
jgi:hypothetical protein